jgi:surface protein
MFYEAEAFNGDISAWDTSAVTDMGGVSNVVCFHVMLGSFSMGAQ